MEDYSLYLIKAQKLLNRILEEANRKEYEKAADYSYALKELSEMLYESLSNQALQKGLETV